MGALGAVTGDSVFDCIAPEKERVCFLALALRKNIDGYFAKIKCIANVRKSHSPFSRYIEVFFSFFFLALLRLGRYRISVFSFVACVGFSGGFVRFLVGRF